MKPTLFLFLACFATASSFAQHATLTVRLYTLHPEPGLNLTSRAGNLRWRLCQQCPSKNTSDLLIEAAGNELQLQGKRAAQVFIKGDYRIDPAQGLKMSLHAPLAISAHDGSLKILATLPLEDYVTAALEGESGSSRNLESLKAMAVAIRTYAVRFRGRHHSEGFDFCDNTHCQNLNFTGATAEVRAAVDATRGELLWYQGTPAATYYHQNCGGTLADAEEVWPGLHAPYLRGREDRFCRLGAPLPWKAILDRKQFDDKLRSQGINVPQSWTTLEVISRTRSGRVSRLAFRGASQPPQYISASSLRFAIGRSFGWNQVRSDLYEVAATNQTVTFTGRGSGHGVGLCQAGAEEMAKQRRSYHEILGFYYPGTVLGTTAKGFAWQQRASANLELSSTQPDQDSVILPVGESVLSALQSELGWKLDFKPQIRVYATIDAYRDATGQPGWIAAFTRAPHVELQPLAILQKKSILESTLRHEFAHLLVESRASPGLPLWFREGLVLCLAGSGPNPNQHAMPVTMPESEMEAILQHPVSREPVQRAYAAARTRVARMIEKNGRPTVLAWLSSGLPAGSGAGLPQH